MSPSDHQGGELAPSGSVSAVQWVQVIWSISAFLDPGGFRGGGPALVTDKQDGIPSLRD